ncbi:hypothetical protein [Saccharothrix sp. HUAS TT1]|uniref:hypothetical protein n=1 Tax=unclassified Saccharothrix TaxID=2593673 RepID=UPI00345B9EE1
MTSSGIPLDKLGALVDEVDAAASLLRHGLAVLKSYRFAARDAYAVFVCLAGGAEKLLKLSAGMNSLHETGVWPSKATMQGWSHDIVGMERHVRAVIVAQQDRSTVPGYMAELLDAVDADPYIDSILETLGTYARGGRFFNLDHLASASQPYPSPRELWEGLHHKLTTVRPELLAKLSSASTSDAARAEMNGHIIESFVGWQELITRAWRTKVFGDEAKRWASQLAPAAP